jgi:alcohol dehydrogenase, propanol-preferring
VWTVCAFCRRGLENLCASARFTGYHRDGGYAELASADARFVVALPDGEDDVEVAPLLCAGLIGYRAYRKAGAARRLGLYGFGAAAHIVAQAAAAEGREVFAFTRPGDRDAQEFARSLGAAWAGDSVAASPEPLDAAIIFAPVGALVPQALASVAPGGRVVCAGIHMSDIPAFPYQRLWGEREVVSVANLTREDGRAFFELLSRITVRTAVRRYPLGAANEALDDLRAGRVQGAAVLVCR